MTKPRKVKAPPPANESTCVFAFRLPIADREAIHQAAGRGQATKFVHAAIMAAVERAQKARK
jgi:hypothetical protein